MILAQARDKGIELPEGMSRGKLIEQLFEEFVEPHLIQPTIVKDYPIEISPLPSASRGATIWSSGSSCSSAGWRWRTRSPN